MSNMDNIKGILFSLETEVTNGKKQFFSKNMVINANNVLGLISKLKAAIDEYEKHEPTQDPAIFEERDQQSIDGEIIDAQKVAFKMKKDANEYADGILSRLQLLVTKLQKNAIKVEKNILEGRKLIEKHQLEHMKGDYSYEKE